MDFAILYIPRGRLHWWCSGLTRREGPVGPGLTGDARPRPGRCEPAFLPKPPPEELSVATTTIPTAVPPYRVADLGLADFGRREINLAHADRSTPIVALPSPEAVAAFDLWMKKADKVPY